MSGNGSNGADGEDVVVRKAEGCWVVGDESVSDLTSAMVLADLFAADQADTGDGDQADTGGQADTGETAVMGAVDENGTPRGPRGPGRATAPPPRQNPTGPQQIHPAADVGGVTNKSAESGEAERLAVTVAQLEHALAARVRVEQAIGVLAERHRLRPRDAFDLLRKASRSRGTRVTEMAHDVVASTANPLLRLPEELARTAPEPRQRGRSLRRGAGRHAASS